MPAPQPTPDLLQRIAEGDFATVAAVADVVEHWGTASMVADGRAARLAEYNHAALIRAAPGDLDALLEKVERFFAKRKRPAAVVVDPLARPPELAELLSARGFCPQIPAEDLLLWDPDAPHLFTAPEAYMTIATNATLDLWLDIAEQASDAGPSAQQRIMNGLAFRSTGTFFWFAQYQGAPVGICAAFVRGGLARIGPVYVRPESRGNGIGLALVHFATRQARKDGADVMYAYLPEGAEAARIYRTTGYVRATPCARALWIRSSTED